MNPSLQRLSQMGSKVVQDVVHDQHTSERVGYLTRAVEDLTFKLERHMEKEEEDRVRDRQEFAEYKSTVNSKVKGLDEKVEGVKEDVGDLKKYILGVTISIGVLGAVFDKIDSSTFASVLGAILKLLG